MKKIMIALLCMYGLFASCAFSFNPPENLVTKDIPRESAISVEQWNNFIKKFPNAAMAVAFVKSYAPSNSESLKKATDLEKSIESLMVFLKNHPEYKQILTRMQSYWDMNKPDSSMKEIGKSNKDFLHKYKIKVEEQVDISDLVKGRTNRIKEFQEQNRAILSLPNTM